MTPHQLSASIGLVLDIAGAIWVVKGLLWVSDRRLAEASDSSATWAGSEPTPRPELMRMFRDSRRDARIGAALLAAGFAGQLLSVWI
jgi:hypothetical protein